MSLNCQHHQEAIQGVFVVLTGRTVQHVIQHAVCFGTQGVCSLGSSYCFLQGGPWLAAVPVPGLGAAALKTNKVSACTVPAGQRHVAISEVAGAVVVGVCALIIGTRGTA